MLELHILPSGGQDYIHIRNCSRDSGYTSFENEDEDRALFLLFQKMIAIFSYIEPADRNLCCYGHWLRALIILASTEFENQCRHILRAKPHFSERERLYFKGLCEVEYTSPPYGL